jgi:acyl-CoA dehydrogenase
MISNSALDATGMNERRFARGRAFMQVSDNIVVDTAARIFADYADSQMIIKSSDEQWKARLWNVLAEAGLTLAWVPENCGGSGADLADGFGVIQAAGRAAIAVPLAETMLAGWLLAQAGLISPAGMMTVAPANPNDRLTLNTDGTVSGRARGVPFAAGARHIAAFVGEPSKPSIALVEASACRIAPGENLAGDPSNAVVFDRSRPIAIAAAPGGFDQTSLMLMGAVSRSLQIAGTLETALEMTVRYANERVAFERQISKFQAVQHNLARLAGEVAAAVTAAGSAANAFTTGTPSQDADFLEAASAKIRCAEAAECATAIAHQVHGAIGFTSEHVLHRHTLRALAWRDDFGHESHWAAELGKRIACLGADQLWPLVASR